MHNIERAWVEVKGAKFNTATLARVYYCYMQLLL